MTQGLFPLSQWKRGGALDRDWEAVHGVGFRREGSQEP